MWAPGMPLTPETPLKPVLASIGFGQQDLERWQLIEQKLAERSVLSFGDLFGTDSESGWTRDKVSVVFKTRALLATRRAPLLATRRAPPAAMRRPPQLLIPTRPSRSALAQVGTHPSQIRCTPLCTQANDVHCALLNCTGTAVTKTKQAKIKFKSAIGPVEAGDPILTNDPVEPPLDKTNVATRHVLIPADMWPGMSDHGWVGKVMKCDFRAPPSCTVKLHDGSHRFRLSTVFERFKPLS